MKCGRWAPRGWGPGLLTRAEPVTTAAMSSDSALRHSGWRQTDTAAAVAGTYRDPPPAFCSQNRPFIVLVTLPSKMWMPFSYSCSGVSLCCLFFFFWLNQFMFFPFWNI